MTTQTLSAIATAPARSATSLTRYLPSVARILVGALFFVVGLNGFLDFLPHPTAPMPSGALAFAIALATSGYMMQLIAGTQLVAGVLLLSNRFVPLALALLAPVVVNIVAFHAFLAPSGLGIALGLVLAELYLAWSYRAAFRPMLAMQTSAGSN